MPGRRKFDLPAERESPCTELDVLIDATARELCCDRAGASIISGNSRTALRPTGVWQAPSNACLSPVYCAAGADDSRPCLRVGNGRKDQGCDEKQQNRMAASHFLNSCTRLKTSLLMTRLRPSDWSKLCLILPIPTVTLDSRGTNWPREQIWASREGLSSWDQPALRVLAQVKVSLAAYLDNLLTRFATPWNHEKCT